MTCVVIACTTGYDYISILRTWSTLRVDASIDHAESIEDSVCVFAGAVVQGAADHSACSSGSLTATLSAPRPTMIESGSVPSRLASLINTRQGQQHEFPRSLGRDHRERR
jgi:hypothetical protein